MKITESSQASAADLGQVAALRRFLEGAVGRPCPGCVKVCHRCGSVGCLCTCGPDCPDAPLALSSDPDKFPIETGIVPLVLAVRRAGLGEPCWSCEGHLNPQGTLWKRPSVWFYAAHQVYPDLIAQHLSVLAGDGRLRRRWRVALIATEHVTATTFAIEPDAGDESAQALEDLRRDARVIADTLPTGARSLAHSRLAALRTSA